MRTANHQDGALRLAGAIVVVGCAVMAWPAAARAESPVGGLSLDPARLSLGGEQPHAAPAATRVAPRAPRMPAVLAGGRADTQKAYTLMLAAFEQNLDKQRLPRNDVAVAAAMYIAGAYGAYHGTQVGDRAFVALVAQLRDALVATTAFTNAPMSQRQDMYEGLAITGTLMAVSAAQKPGDPSVRSAARTYLESFLRSGADSIQITERGMSVALGAAPSAGSPAPALPPSSPPAVTEDTPPPRHPFPSAKVAAVLWKAQAQYRAFPENSMVMVESNYLLLGDGTCTSRVPASFDDFEPKADRAANPKSWCKWRKRGAGYEVAFAEGKWLAVNGATVMRAAKRGERLTGTWSRSKTATMGTASSWKGTTLVLASDGRFELTRGGAFTSNGNVNRPAREVVVSGTYDNRQERGDSAGTYALDGFGIELRFDSGRVERKLFGISTDSDHDVVRLGGDVMPKRK
jgi:hypothetical protein